MKRLAQPLFWTAAAFALLMALMKHPPPIPEDPSDKLQHAFAFLVLAILAAWAYPRLSPWTILLGLVMFGGAIELLQGLPFIHRDPDVRDWATDAAAAAATLLVVSTVQRLRRLRRRPLD